MARTDDIVVRELRRQTRLMAERKASRAAVFWLAFVTGGLVVLGVSWPLSIVAGAMASVVAYVGKLQRALNR